MDGIIPQQTGLSTLETQSAVNDGLNSYQIYQNPAVGSLADVALRGGKIISNYKSFSANNTSETINVFEISGNIKIHGLYGIVQATSFGNHTGAYFDAYGSASTPLTEHLTGVDLSNASQGAMIYKSDLATAALDFTDNPSAAPILNEKDPSSRPFTFLDFDLRSEAGQTTYIRYTYTTTDTPTTGDIYFYIVYTPLDDFSWAVAAF